LELWRPPQQRTDPALRVPQNPQSENDHFASQPVEQRPLPRTGQQTAPKPKATTSASSLVRSFLQATNKNYKALFQKPSASPKDVYAVAEP
jgi:hypothetical protein